MLGDATRIGALVADLVINKPLGLSPSGIEFKRAYLPGANPVGSGALAPFIAGGAVPNGTWAKVTIPFSSLGVTSGSFDGFWLQDGTGGNQAAVYVDDVVLIERPAAPPVPVTVPPSVKP